MIQLHKCPHESSGCICRRKRPAMTKLYAASDDEKSGGDGDDNASDDELLRADELPGGSPAAADVASPQRRRRRLTATQDTDGECFPESWTLLVSRYCEHELLCAVDVGAVD